MTQQAKLLKHNGMGEENNCLGCKIHKMSDATIVANVSMAIKW